MTYNPSPIGAFAEGIAGGMKGGMENYVQLAIAGIDREQRKAIAAGEMSYKIFSDENLPLEVRKKAYEAWRQGNKDYNTGIKAPDFPDEYWTNKKLTPFFKKGQAILKNKEYTLQQKMEYLRGLEVEAIDSFGAGASKVFEPLKEQVGQEQVSGLFKPTQKTIPEYQPEPVQSQLGVGFQPPAIRKTMFQEPSPTTQALGLSPQEAETMGLLTGAGVDITKARALMPKAKIEKTKVAKSFILPDNKTTVLSYDGGLTYKDKEGVSRKIPFGALPITTTLEQAQARSAVGIARGGETTEIVPDVTPEKAALKGTGPYAMLKSTVDAIVGGATAGAIDLFPETMENRQALRIVKQMGKAVLLNSPRGAIWEQQKIDKLFPNPDIFWASPVTEAKKITSLRNVMLNEKAHNNRQISSGVLTSKEIQKYRNSNAEIDKVITLIGQGETRAAGKTTTLTMPDGSTQTFNEAGKRVR